MIAIDRLTDASDPRWSAMLALYESEFRSGEKESREALERRLCPDGAEAAGGHIVLAASDGSEVCGGVLFSYLPRVACGYISYLVVAPPRRRTGLGTSLYHAVRRSLEETARRLVHRPVRGAFIELEIDEHREPFWRGLGVRTFDVQWLYPELMPAHPPVPMDLAFGAFDGQYDWTPSELIAATTAIFDATYRYLPDASATVSAIVGGLKRLPRDSMVPYRAMLHR